MNIKDVEGLCYTALSLVNFSVQDIKVPRCMAYSARLGGDLKKYWVNFNTRAPYQLCPEFDKGKFIQTSIWYGQADNPVPANQIVDTLFALALLKEGLLVSKPVYSKDHEVDTLMGLKIIDPLTGSLVRKINDAVITDHYARSAYDLGHNLQIKVNESYVYVKERTGRNYYFFPLDGSTPFVSLFNQWPDQIYDKYAVSATHFINRNEMKIETYSVISGETLFDTTYNTNIAAVCTMVKDTLWTFSPGKALLTKEFFQNDKLYPVNQYTLDTFGVNMKGNPYKAIITKGRLVAFPANWRRPGESGNQLYIWDIKTGRMLFKIEDFYSPTADFLAVDDANKAYWAKYWKEQEEKRKQEQIQNRPKSCEEKLRELKFKPGDYIIRDHEIYKDDEWVLIQGYNCQTGIYDLIYLDKRNSTIKDSRSIESFKEGWSKGKVPYHRCVCNGRSEWMETTREAVGGWEQVNFNVYVNDPNKTRLVTRKVTCPECRGLGWVKNK